jgi:putative ABC transport system permease protein
MTVSFDIRERPAVPSARPRSDMAFVTPGYFRTIGMPLLAGRDFTERDDGNAAPVVIVNDAFAREFFPGENAVGKFIRSGASSRRQGNPMREIVGIVANAKQSPGPAPDPIYYIPYRQLAWGAPAVIVRTSLPPLSLESSLRRVVASLDREVPIYEIHTFEEIASTAMAPPRFLLCLFGTFAGIGLLLMAIGLYGVLCYSVLRRTREIGIRIALGADRGMIISMVLRHALNLVAAGIALGLAGAAAGDRILQQLLFGATPSRPLLMALACAVVTVTAALAAYLPARRAASIAPTDALRAE